MLKGEKSMSSSLLKKKKKKNCLNEGYIFKLYDPWKL